MRWQGVARAVVALIGIGCAAAVYVSLRPREEIVEIPQATAVLDDSAKAAMKGTQTRRVDDAGREAYFMNAGTTRVLADGRTLATAVRFKFAKNGVGYNVTADEAELSGKAGPTGEEPSLVVFRKKVKMVGDDGFSVESEDATYQSLEQLVTFPADVAFTRDRIQGKGVGATLHMDRSVLWLNDQSEMTITPENGGAPVVVSGKRIGLAQTEGYLRAEENTRLTRESQQLFSDAMTVHFVEGTQSVRRIEMMGRSRVQNRGTAGARRPDMQADNIDLDFTPERNLLNHARLDTGAVLTIRDDAGVTRITGSSMEMYVGADGETLTKLDVFGPTEVVLPRTSDSPARTITSTGLVAEGADPKGLERAVFSGGIQYRETLPGARGQAASIRLARSQSLVLSLAGALNQVSDATFRQDFCFVGPVTTAATPADLQCAKGRMLPTRGTLENTVAAAGEEGIYNAKAEKLHMKALGPTRPSPRVANREVDLESRQIDVDIKQDVIDALGQAFLTKRAAQAKPASPQAPGLFEKSKALSVRSNSLKYSKVTGMTTYAGNVVMLQDGDEKESSDLRADEITVDDQKQDIKATGKVRLDFSIEQSPDDAAKKGGTRTVLTGDAMTYTESQRRAVFTGKSRMETTEATDKQSLDAARITLELEKERRALKWLEADADAAGSVLARLPEGRQATGTRLTYDAQKQLYIATGTPAQVVSPTTTAGTCDVGTGSKVEFPRGVGELTVTTEGSAQARGRQQRCSEVIKK